MNHIIVRNCLLSLTAAWSNVGFQVLQSIAKLYAGATFKFVNPVKVTVFSTNQLSVSIFYHAFFF